MHDPEFLVNLWLTLKPYIQKKEALEAAVSMLRTAEEFGDVESISADMRGQDNTLDSALNELYEYSETQMQSTATMTPTKAMRWTMMTMMTKNNDLV